MSTSTTSSRPWIGRSPASRWTSCVDTHRSQITPSSFVYNYGDFRGAPDKLIDKYFDASPVPCYTVGIPYGLSSLAPDRITPLVLDGVVSGVDKTSGTLYISAPTFKGNSGGPAFVYRSPFNVAGGLTVGKPPVLFAGLVIQQMLVTGAASTQMLALATYEPELYAHYCQRAPGYRCGHYNHQLGLSQHTVEVVTEGYLRLS